MTSKNESFNFAKMVEEMKALREKYAIPKGFLLVPDKMEITVKRIGNDMFHLSYKEYFSYLPDYVFDWVIPMTISMLSQIGFPKEKITRPADDCVGTEIDGNFRKIGSAIISELLMQKRFDDGELESLLEASARTNKALGELANMEREWNNEVEKKYSDSLGKQIEVFQKHPEIKKEMDAIFEKCKQ